MNFALSTILIIILLLPGAIANGAYYNHLKAKISNIHIPLAETLIKGLLFSLIFHAAAVCIMRWWLELIPRFDLLYQIIGGKDLNLKNEDHTTFFLQFVLYSFILIVSAWIIGKVFKLIMESTRVTLNYNAFRNANYWFEIFSAKYLDRAKVRGKREDADLLFLDILTTDKIIYSGFLKDFNYSPHKDKLENIVLTRVQKRFFDKEKLPEPPPQAQRISTTGAPHFIPGDVFIIPAEQIVNINVYYVKVNLSQKPNSTAPPTTGP